MNKVGFIGVGIMGKSMVRNLMKAGFELHIYARTKSKVNDVIEEGAIFHETIGECVRASEAVITMVGFPQDVEEVYFGFDANHYCLFHSEHCGCCVSFPLSCSIAFGTYTRNLGEAACRFPDYSVYCSILAGYYDKKESFG